MPPAQFSEALTQHTKPWFWHARLSKSKNTTVKADEFHVHLQSKSDLFRALAVCMNLGLWTAGWDRSQGHIGEDWLKENKRHCTTDDKHKQGGIVFVFDKTVAHFELRFLFLNIQQTEQTCSWLKQNKQQYWWQAQTRERQITHTHKKHTTTYKTVVHFELMFLFLNIQQTEQPCF